MLELILSTVTVVVVALIGALGATDLRRKNRQEKRLVSRAQLRADESRLSMKMMSAAIDLGVATAIAVEEGRTNGEMKLAREHARAVRAEYDAFINKVAANEVASNDAQ